jgi:hypothetical protein
LLAVDLGLVDRQLGEPPMRLKGNPIGALNAFQRTGDREGLAAEHFQFGTQLEVVGRFFRPAEARVGQAAEVVAAGVAAAASDGGGQ